MANVIGLHPQAERNDSFSMSNGLTAVFTDVLALSGSRLAQTADEKRLVVWLSERDQSKLGGGTVGFDLCDMPWNPQTFEDNKKFLLSAAESAKHGLGWEYLDYTPNKSLLFPCLDKFAALISKLDIVDICPNALEEWLDAADDSDPVRRGFPTCPKHHTLLTVFGCHLCNN